MAKQPKPAPAQEPENEAVNDETPLDESQDPPQPEPEVFDNTKLKLADVMNIEYCTDDATKKDLEAILVPLRPMTDVNVKISSGHDMVVTRNHKQVLRVTPLKKGFSFSLAGGKITREGGKDVVLKFIKNDFAE